MARRVEVLNGDVGRELERVLLEIKNKLGQIPYEALKPMSEVAKNNLEQDTPLAPGKQGLPSKTRKKRRKGKRVKYNLPGSKKYLVEHAKDNVEVLMDPKGFTLKFHEDMYYIDFVEHGTARMAAQPFMADSLERSKSEMIDIVKEKIREGVRTI